MKLRYLFFVLIILITACTESLTDSGEAVLPRDLTKSEKALVQAGWAFSIEMFKELALKEEKKNVLISPLSISLALGMTLNGAKSKTYEEIQNTLFLDGMSLPEINEGYNSLMELLTSIDPKVQMEIANSVWIRQGFQVEEEFSSRLTDFFDAESQELDFNDNKSADIINEWVDKKTHGKINKIVDGISPETVMFLINAVYFKGDWVYEFDPELTEKRYFELESGEGTEVDMMNQKVLTHYYASETVEMVDLPYGNGFYTMSLIKPTKRETKINSFIENELTLSNLENWYKNSSKDSVGVFLPKLELKYEETLNKPLINLGMPGAFLNSANFSGINPNVQLTITSIKHKTFLKLDEVGTEAAAVTSVGVGTTSAGPKDIVFSFDRSYLMILREKESGTIMFIGKVMNPEN